MSDEPKTTEFPKAYDPKQWEESILRSWEEADLARPETCIEAGITPKDAEAFSIVLPPPNVTGTLHIGHAAMLAIEDTIVRFKRMSGYRTLWLPGTDHAAIATESKVEKILREKEGKTRQSLGREAFLDEVKKFALESHDTIVGQVKRMGSSVDWSREAYTLDEDRSLAVRTAFKRMYDAGIIYRGNRIVNWDPVGQTTISDDEVVYKEETTKFYYLKYGPFEIATARPETKFGDKYVVMHPDDERYVRYAHGEKLTVEWINGPIEATIIKDEVIDREFGTGVMTITPWHSVTDFELAEKHKLSMEQIIDLSGNLLPIAGEEFAGMSITEAREKITAKLESKGLVTKIEDGYVHKVATAERTGAIIEPQVMRQWFIGVNQEFERDGEMITLKRLMQKAVRNKEISILPERFEKNYFYWIDNLRDWCISRQIWFGHRIPVWYCKQCAGIEVFARQYKTEDELRIRSEEELSKGWHNRLTDVPLIVSVKDPEKCPNCNGDELYQDPDTLDTWFSSGLWTFSTLGWPDEKANDFQTYHPTTLLETGYDILFFWVARMILMSEYLLGTIPFKTVYLHGLVRDEKGRKMSKSLGNTINPLDIADEFGADALRLALVMGSTPGNDVKVGREKITAMRNFVNKLWNMGRYVATTTESTNNPDSAADAWILFKLNETIQSVNQLMEKNELALAAGTLQEFTWNDFADWYIEVHKIEKNNNVLNSVFEKLLRLWHPFMPFVTEALFQAFHPNEDSLLMGQQYPKTVDIPQRPILTRNFDEIKNLITKIRNVRSIYHIDPKETLTLTLIGEEEKLASFVPIIQRLGRIDDVLLTNEAAQPSATASIVIGTLHGFVHLGDVIDIEKEKVRLMNEKTKLAQSITAFEQRLMDKNFRAKAPAEIIAAQEKTLTENTAKLATLTESIAALN